jgi:hypothetical protein
MPVSESVFVHALSLAIGAAWAAAVPIWKHKTRQSIAKAMLLHESPGRLFILFFTSIPVPGQS